MKVFVKNLKIHCLHSVCETENKKTPTVKNYIEILSNYNAEWNTHTLQNSEPASKIDYKTKIGFVDFYRPNLREM